MKLKLALFCTLGLASINAMASCYTVYDSSNRVIYNSAVPPVDMSRQIHETLPSVYPGGHLVFGTSVDCPVPPPARITMPTPSTRPSPVLTKRRTSGAMTLPNRMLPSEGALVSNLLPMGNGVTGVAASVPAPVVTAPALRAQRLRSFPCSLSEELLNVTRVGEACGKA